MDTYPIVPKGYGIGFPMEAHLEIGVLTDLVEQEGQDGI